MQTRKKGAARNAAGDHANPKTSRPLRRATQPTVAEKKVTDLITSSSKKQKPGKDFRVELFICICCDSLLLPQYGL